MDEIKDESQRVNFIIVDRKIFKTKLSKHAKLVYIALLQYADKKNECFPSLNLLATDTTCSRTTVWQAIEELTEKKLLIKQQTKEDGRYKNNLYIIIDLPKDDPITKYFDDETLNEKFKEYLKMRVEKKCKATPTTVKSLIDKLNKHNISTALAMLQYSIDNGYQGVFEPKGDKPSVETKEPTWLDKKISSKEATTEEEAKMKAMLEEFK